MGYRQRTLRALGRRALFQNRLGFTFCTYNPGVGFVSANAHTALPTLCHIIHTNKHCFIASQHHHGWIVHSYPHSTTRNGCVDGIIRRIEEQGMTLALLTATGVGRVVNKVRKESTVSAAVKERAKKLVHRWKVTLLPCSTTSRASGAVGLASDVTMTGGRGRGGG